MFARCRWTCVATVISIPVGRTWKGLVGGVNETGFGFIWMNVCLLSLGERPYWPGWSSRRKDQGSGKLLGGTPPQTHFYGGNAPAGKILWTLTVWTFNTMFNSWFPGSYASYNCVALTYTVPSQPWCMFSICLIYECGLAVLSPDVNTLVTRPNQALFIFYLCEWHSCKCDKCVCFVVLFAVWVTGVN